MKIGMVRGSLAGAAVVAVVWASGAGAQTSNYKSAEAEAGKPVRLSVVTPFKKDCSVGELGGVRVVNAPKNGSVTLKRGKLKTPGTFRCPNVDTTAEAVIYVSKPNFTGKDEVVYDTKSADGEITRFTVQITVTAGAPGKPGPAKDKKPELQEL